MVKFYKLYILIDEIDEETGDCETIAEPIEVCGEFATENEARSARARIVNNLPGD